MRVRLVILVSTAACLGGLLSAAAAQAAVKARVEGTFKMRARVTVAVNVRNEHKGEFLTRKWVVSPADCTGDVCQTLHLDRQRSDKLYSKITLHRNSNGRYTGRAVFYGALECLGKVYKRGLRVPYRVTLRIVSEELDGGIEFAKQITGTYVNKARIDTTPCPLGPSHDAANYRGVLVAGLPVAPVASFTYKSDTLNDTVSFTDTSTPGARGSALVAQLWNFGDPNSGSADSSSAPDPAHQFTAPGQYTVSLTVTDAAGLQSTVSEVVTASRTGPSQAPG